jgi:hypothetical protein
LRSGDRDPGDRERLLVQHDSITDRNSERVGEGALEDDPTWSHPAPHRE